MRLYLITFIAVIAITIVGHFGLDMYLHQTITPLRALLTKSANYFSYLGDGTAWIVGPLILYLVTRFAYKNEPVRSASLFMFFAVAGSGLVTLVLKMLFGRARPFIYDWYKEYGYSFFASDYGYLSFPSGHTTTFFALATYFSLLLPQWRYPLFGVAILGGLSRMILNKHYFSDVVAGAFVGTLFTLWVYTSYYQKKVKGY